MPVLNDTVQCDQQKLLTNLPYYRVLMRKFIIESNNGSA